MKLLAVFAGVLFLASTAEAQLYPGYPNLQPYYPGAITQPFYPQAYYPVPFGLPNYGGVDPLAMQRPGVVQQPTVSNMINSTDIVRQQVDQLTDQVRSVQAELTTAQQELAQLRASEIAPGPAKPETPVVLVFKNGAVLESKGYAVARGRLWILTPSGPERIALSSLNVPETQRENLKRGINFPNLTS
jgi:hypothetical protein